MEHDFDRPTEEVIHNLSEDECWDLLSKHEFGRLAFHLAGDVDIRPINYVVHDRQILFITAPGDKLLGIVMNSDVAFEIDEVLKDEHAMSVIVHGNARHLDGPDAQIIEQLPLRPWVPTAKYDVVAITPSFVTGKRFDLSRPWSHMRPMR
ncbi:pyridoxamine 5'-phosphate oxidase family protein [Actinomycetota bacterium]